ncbi:DsrE family protein [Clostridium tarantellae]|uniref:Uncharacterized protein n=1 Tax=Clostridium tarantellae TaxID=39493 RepID=A0A6I1MQH2_9CLOT|nr:DsrE family protein [Clostridium tarantellae]MPQ45294.1 hypothetical protein [Clostridium tarantellae]
MKVLLHINEQSKWNMLLDNAKHMLASDEKFILEVVANGEAVKTLQKQDEYSNSIFELSKKGIKFIACNNSINKFNINKNSLYEFVIVVPAGMVEIAKKQNCGYSYIKP